MIAATQADITALGWYYIPVVMLSAALAIGVGLVTNNMRRRYPVYWVIPGKIPSRHAATPFESSPQELVTEQALPSGLSKMHIDEGKDRVIVTASGFSVPEYLDLEEENKQVLQELQKLLAERTEGSMTPARGEKSV